MFPEPAIKPAEGKPPLHLERCSSARIWFDAGEWSAFGQSTSLEHLDEFPGRPKAQGGATAETGAYELELERSKSLFLNCTISCASVASAHPNATPVARKRWLHTKRAASKSRQDVRYHYLTKGLGRR